MRQLLPGQPPATALFRLLLLSAGAVQRAASYAEGIFPIQHGRAALPPLSFASPAGPAPACERLELPNSTAATLGLPLELVGQLPAGTPRHGQHPQACATVLVRSSAEHAYWYSVPPSPLADRRSRHCGPVGPEQVFKIGVPGVKLPAGFTTLTAWLEGGAPAPAAAACRTLLLRAPPPAPLLVSARGQLAADRRCVPPPRSSSAVDPTTPHAAAAGAHGAATELRLWVAKGPEQGWAGMASELEESIALARQDEAADRQAAEQKAAALSGEYEPLHGGLAAALASGHDGFLEYKLLDPQLAAALRRGTPEALWGLLRGGDHETRCGGGGGGGGGGPAAAAACESGVFTFPVFQPAVRAPELQHTSTPAHASTAADLLKQGVGGGKRRPRRRSRKSCCTPRPEGWRRSSRSRTTARSKSS